MKDWKGNEVQVGDRLIIFNAEGQHAGAEYEMIFCLSEGMISADKPGKVHSRSTKKVKVPVDYKWEKYTSCKVVEQGNLVELGGDDSEIPINHLGFFFPIQHWQVLCIEGKSDNQEEYYLHKFAL